MSPHGPSRVLAVHTRAEPLVDLLRRIDEGAGRPIAHGYLNRGGTLAPFGMLFASRSTWAHLLLSAASLLGIETARLLSADEAAASRGEIQPDRLASVKRPTPSA